MALGITTFQKALRARGYQAALGSGHGGSPVSRGEQRLGLREATWGGNPWGDEKAAECQKLGICQTAPTEAT